MAIKNGIADLTKHDPGMSAEEAFYREYSGLESPKDDHLGLGIPHFSDSETLFRFMRAYLAWVRRGQNQTLTVDDFRDMASNTSSIPIKSEMREPATNAYTDWLISGRRNRLRLRKRLYVAGNRLRRAKRSR